MRLFVERAQAARADFALTDANAEAVVAICRKLDGLPLAIELAAARLGALPPAGLLARLEHRLSLLVGGRKMSRHGSRRCAMRSVGAADCWARRQRLFRHLSIFAGGLTLEAAEWVASEGEEGALR